LYFDRVAEVLTSGEYGCQTASRSVAGYHCRMVAVWPAMPSASVVIRPDFSVSGTLPITGTGLLAATGHRYRPTALCMPLADWLPSAGLAHATWSSDTLV
jgi:hypothetical protein